MGLCEDHHFGWRLPLSAIHSANPRDYPAHLWIRGISPDGKTFPHLFGITQTAGEVFFTNKFGTGAASLTLDNLEIGYWNGKAIVPTDGTTWTLRNVYVHDTLDGFESGNSTNLTVNIYNSVFARNGGGAGPDHNVYIGAGNLGSTVNVINSVFEQANLGHSFKTRASEQLHLLDVRSLMRTMFISAHRISISTAEPQL